MGTTNFVLDVSVALALGMAIGLERQFRQHTAGLRTNVLVCAGSALFVSLGNIIGHEGDVTRVVANVVSGIGFLGGGVIFKEGLSVRGLATAATLWCSAAVGALAGAGMLLQATFATGVVLFVHLALRPVVHQIQCRFSWAGEFDNLYRVRLLCPGDRVEELRSRVFQQAGSQPGMSLHAVTVEDTERPSCKALTFEIFGAARQDSFINDLVCQCSGEPNVTSASWERIR
jgi:putative Mg2+ transporter-C (MgtC) family protein